MKTFRKLLSLFTFYEKKQGFLLLLLIIIVALIDTIGVASILPFIAVLSNPNVIETNFILNYVYNFSKIFGIENYQKFTFFLGLFVLILLLTSLFARVITVYAQARFAEMRHFSISRRLIESYLKQPYQWFLDQNSSEIGKNILAEVNFIISSGFTQILEGISKGAVVFTILTLLIIVDPKLALIVFSIIASAYGLIFYILKKKIILIGEERLKHNGLRFKVVSEAFKAFKEVKLGGLENNYIKRFANSAEIYAKSSTKASVITQLPRYILEALIFGGVLIILLYLMKETGSFNNSLPIISLYVFAGYRLLPSLQQVYASLTQLNFIKPSVDNLYDQIQNLKPLTSNQDKGILSINKSIDLKNIHYAYPSSSRTILRGIDIRIPVKSTVGLIGSTGCGKTTIIDIILGLLEPKKGSLEVDGKVITKKNLRSWQSSIGYVPQSIYLLDDTIAANIAIGQEQKDINYETIIKCAKIANLHKFISEELSDQYKSMIGENGIKLSGGQRQRLGIARALYHNPQLLILDEATSALDTETEKAVIDAINNLHKDITIIFVAHRLNTIKNCDTVLQVDKGNIKRIDNFNG
jgi:ABC-type multidrug transport system fused ATPase/permease subunit